MFSNFSSAYRPITHYPARDSTLPFTQYIATSRTMIEERRQDLRGSEEHIERIILANTPYELYPVHAKKTHRKLKTGVLLIHGLLDCPFTLREIGMQLQAKGILCRSVLLPGHGTRPSDLMHISYHDWLDTTRYGINSLQSEVENIVLVGYSTGAAISLYESFLNENIAGLVMISPAIKLKSYLHFMTHFYHAMRFGSNDPWLVKSREIDYAKYHSIPYHAVYQVENLASLNQQTLLEKKISHPLAIFISEYDETVCASTAMDFFLQTTNDKNRFYLYTPETKMYQDPRMIACDTHYPALEIDRFGHSSLPFSIHNQHYGEHGDYSRATHPHSHRFTYQGYTRTLESFYPWMKKLGLIKKIPRDLTFNPAFDDMMQKTLSFIESLV